MTTILQLGVCLNAQLGLGWVKVLPLDKKQEYVSRHYRRHFLRQNFIEAAKTELGHMQNKYASSKKWKYLLTRECLYFDCPPNHGNKEENL